jgi:hypothetical protein
MYVPILCTQCCFEKKCYFSITEAFFTSYNPLPVIRVSTLNFASSPVIVPDIMCLIAE